MIARSLATLPTRRCAITAARRRSSFYSVDGRRRKPVLGPLWLISSEPGIGKSRLTETFRQSLAGDSYKRLRYFCSPHHRDSALFPIISQLERAAAVACRGCFGWIRPRRLSLSPRISDLDPESFCLEVAGWNEWFLRYPDQALQAALQGVTLARSQGYPQSVDQALHGVAHAVIAP
jgi:predicted ATPase